MFKNATIYKAEIPCTLLHLNEALAGFPFTSCGASQEQSMGWAPPRNVPGPFAESIGGHWILRFAVETKSVPATTVRAAADAEAKRIEETTGRKPGKKEMRDIREDAKRALLPHAFPRVSTVTAWYDPGTFILVLDTTSQARADAIITALVQAVPAFKPQMLVTQATPQYAMARWLAEGEADGQFQLENACELKSCAEDRAIVKYNRHTLDIDEVKAHIKQGKLPTKLALNWKGRVAFTLTESLRLTKLKFLDTVFEGTKDEKADNFDADVAIMTGELSPLIAELVEELGGEFALQEGGAA